MENKHSHHHARQDGLTLAFWLNFLFSVIELGGGIFTNSRAIMADAFHDFMDAIAIGASLLLEKVSGKKPTSTFTYGYKRFSLLAALGMSVFLLVGAAGMIINAIQALRHPVEVNSVGMWWLAVLGVIINGFAFFRIKSGEHHHAHEGQHHNSQAIMLHLLEDVLGWVAVLLGAVLIYFTGWYWIDGALALAIAIFIGYNATKNLISTIKVLLQAVPVNINVAKLAAELSCIKGVSNVHDLHIWSLDGSYNISTLHAVINDQEITNTKDIYGAIVQLLEKYNLHQPTIQFETTGKTCQLLPC